LQKEVPGERKSPTKIRDNRGRGPRKRFKQETGREKDIKKEKVQKRTMEKTIGQNQYPPARTKALVHHANSKGRKSLQKKKWVEMESTKGRL